MTPAGPVADRPLAKLIELGGNPFLPGSSVRLQAVGGDR
jgi:hypothetical protein